MQINKDFSKFAEEGYIVQDLVNTLYLSTFKEFLLNKLIEITGYKNITLENFHEFIKNEKDKINIQFKLSEMIWKEKLHFKIIQDNIDLYYNLIGKDLDIQMKPHLRIARPHCPEDNVGFHRDTQYGNSAYEISNFIPLVDLDENSALQIEPASHKRGTIPYSKIPSKSVKKGSIENQLGYVYEEKRIDKNFKIKPNPIPLKYKQLLIIGLGTIHGQEINTSNITRWSIDIRVKNSFSQSNVKEDYYSTLSSSVVSDYARIYYKECND